MSQCKTCGARLSDRNRSGLCRRHAPAALARRPEWVASVKAGIARAMSDPVVALARKETMKRNRTAYATETRSETAKRLRIWEKGHAAISADPGIRARRNAKQSATKLAHIPREKRDDYRHLTQVKRLPAAEAARVVLAAHEAEMARFRREIGRGRGA